MTSQPPLIELPAKLAVAIDSFIGRRWVLNALTLWFDASADRFLVLTGDPGTGKSMVLAWLAGFGPVPREREAREQLLRLRSEVRATHFCQARSRNITPRAFAEAIANQLTRTIPGFASALVASLDARVTIIGRASATKIASGASLTGVSIGRLDLTKLTDDDGFDRAFVAPLKRLYASGERAPILLIVDALDEAHAHGEGSLVHLLARHEDLPPNVRIIVSTRNDPRVRKFFALTTRIDLRQGDASNADVRAFIVGRMSSDGAARDRFVERLAGRADGVFLYAALVLADLVRRQDEPDLDTYPLPEGLSELYHEFLTRELGNDESLWFELYEPLLGLIGVAQDDGLTTAQLTTIAGRDVRPALRAIKQFLVGELPHGPFRLFHQSFADFLLDHDESNIDYGIEPTACHGRIADYYQRAVRELGDSLNEPDDYGLDNLCWHLAAAGRAAEVVQRIDLPWMKLRLAQARGTYDFFHSDLTLAQHVAVTEELGLEALLHLKAAEWVVYEQVSSYDDNCLVLLARLGRLAEALAHARLRSEPSERVESLLALSQTVTGDSTVMLRAEAFRAACVIVEPPSRIYTLYSFVCGVNGSDVFTASDVVEEIQQCCGTIGSASMRAEVQPCVVAALKRAGRHEEAARCALEIADNAQRARALSADFTAPRTIGPRAMKRALASLRHYGEPHRFRQVAIDKLLALGLGELRSPKSTSSSGEISGRAESLGLIGAALIDMGAPAAVEPIARALQRSGAEPLSRELLSIAAVTPVLDDQDDDNNRRCVSVVSQLAIDCADAGDIELSLGVHKLLSDERESARVDECTPVILLVDIAVRLVRRTDSQAEGVLIDALNQAAALDGDARSRTFGHLAWNCFSLGDHDSALVLLRLIHRDRAAASYPDDYGHALESVVIAFASAGHPAAHELIQAAVRWCKRQASWVPLSSLASALASIDFTDCAFEIRQSLPRNLANAEGWSELGVALAQQGDDERAGRAFARALDTIMGNLDHGSPSGTYIEALVAKLVQARHYERIPDVVAGILAGWERFELLLNAASTAASQNDLQASHMLLIHAERTARIEVDPEQSGEKLAYVGGLWAKHGRVDDAWRVACTIAEGEHRAVVLCAVARHWMAAGNARGQELLAEGLRILALEPSGALLRRWQRADALRADAARLDREGEVDADVVWSTANTLADSLWAYASWSQGAHRARALASIAGTVQLESDREHVFELALRAVQSIDLRYLRGAQALLLVRKMIEVGRFDLAERANDACHSDNELLRAYCGNSQPDEALRLAANRGFVRSDDALEIASAYVRMGRSKEAVRAIEVLKSQLSLLQQYEMTRALVISMLTTAAATEPERELAFELAHRSALALGHGHDRHEALRDLIKRMIAVGRLDLAERAFADLDWSGRDSDAEALAKAFCDASQPDAALRITSGPTEEIAAAFVRLGRFEEAVGALVAIDLDWLIGSTARVMILWNTGPVSIRMNAVRTMVHVASWVRSDWHELLPLLSADGLDFDRDDVARAR